MADEKSVATPLRREHHSLYPETSGEEICKAGHYWGPGIRSHYLVHYVISGRGRLFYDDREFQVKKGQIFVVFPWTVIKYEADCKDPWHYVWTSFFGDEAERIFGQLGISPDRPIFTVKNGAEVLETVRSMPPERSNETKTNLDFSARLYEFMSLLMENANEHEDRESGYLGAAKRYIRSHYFEDITVEGIAAHLGISRKYLFAIFKSRLGISPKDYVVDYRMKKAAEFLRNEGLSVGNIAYSVGYKDPLTFSKMFKLKMGVSPSEYRAMSIQGAR